MKIAISTDGENSNSTVAPFFDCGGDFIVYDSEKFEFTYYNYSLKQDPVTKSGLNFGTILADAGVEVLVVGGIATQIARMLGSFGIRIYECINATAWETIDGLKLNSLQRIDSI